MPLTQFVPRGRSKLCVCKPTQPCVSIREARTWYGTPCLTKRIGTRFSKMSLSGVEAVNACRDWVKEGSGTINGALHFDSVEKRSRRGVLISATKTVLEGTELLGLPEGRFLGVKEAKRLLDEAYKGFCSSGLVEDPETYVSLGLLLERSKGSRSEFYVFLRMLPDESELDSVPMWNDEELEMLHGSPSYSNVKTWLKDTEAEWSLLDKEIFQKNRNVFPSEHFSIRLYQWALCITSSRGFYVSQSEPAVLAPVLSFLSPPIPGCKPTTGLEMKGGVLFTKRKLVLTAKKDMEDGNVLTISYGKGLRNAELAVVRGLTIDDSRFYSFILSFELSALDRFYDDKRDILENADVELDPKFEIVNGEREEEYQAPHDMDAFLRLLCLTGADAFLLEAVFRSDVWEFMELPVSYENEKAVCELVANACADALDEYTQSRGNKVDENESERERMAKCIVQGERKILENVENEYRRRLKSLDGLEYYAERRLKVLDLLRPVDECEIVDSESGGRVARAFDENY